MDISEMLLVHAESGVAEGVVLATNGTRTFVATEGTADAIAAEHLHTSGNTPVQLVPGDRVLLWYRASSPAVIIGRIGASAAAESGAADDTPDELVIEAKESLTLRVGAGSITLRADGRILIKGKDLVSHAQRTNRIRGGSVAIN